MIINIIDAVDKHLECLARNNDRDNSHFHPSSWDGCKRQHAYAYYESKGYIKIDDNSLKISPQLERIFGNGHKMHDRWRGYLENTGALMGVWQCCNFDKHTKFFGDQNKLGCLRPEKCECGCRKFLYHEIGFLDNDTMWGGHVDAVLDQKILAGYLGINCKILPEEDLILVDFKTINAFEFKSLSRPKNEHITQMQIYLYLSGLKYGKFIYECKNSQSVKEYLVIADDNLISVKKAEALALKNVVSLTVSGKHRLPHRGFSSKAHPTCQRCKYRGHCWSEKHTENKQKIATGNKQVGCNIGDADV